MTYKLVDLQGEKVAGSFYEQELQKARQQNLEKNKTSRLQEETGIGEMEGLSR